MPETPREELERLRREQAETPRQELERLRTEQAEPESPFAAFSAAGIGGIGPDGVPLPSVQGMEGFREGEGPEFGPLDFLTTLGGVGDLARSAVTSAVTEGLGGLVGIGETTNRLLDPLRPPQFRTPTDDTPGAGSQQTVRDFFEPLNRPRTETSETIAQGLGELVEPIDTALTDALDTGSPGASSAIKTMVVGLPEIIGGRAALRTARRSESGRIGVGEELPSVEDLFNTARTAYARANRLGGGIRRGRLERTAQRLENMRSRDGEPIIIDQQADPRAFAIQRRIIEDFRSPEGVSFEDLNAHRRLAQSLADSDDNFTSMLGQRMREEIDDLVFNLQPRDMISGNARGLQQSLTTARALWRDASAASEIQRRMRRAQERSGQFSGSGYENALRTEFRQLAMQIIDKKQRFFTPEEVALIQQVSSGNQNLRNIGRLAPSSFLNTAVGGSAVGALAASAGLNPALGLLVPAVGQIGRSMATRRGINAANQALEAPLRRSLLDQSQ